MFVYGDIVKAPKHKFIVVSVDDSNPKGIQYGLIRYNKDNVKVINNDNLSAPKPQYWYSADVLEFVEQA